MKTEKWQNQKLEIAGKLELYFGNILFEFSTLLLLAFIVVVVAFSFCGWPHPVTCAPSVWLWCVHGRSLCISLCNCSSCLFTKVRPCPHCLATRYEYIYTHTYTHTTTSRSQTQTHTHLHIYLFATPSRFIWAPPQADIETSALKQFQPWVGPKGPKLRKCTNHWCSFETF